MCTDCPYRPNCVSPCGYLEAELSKVTKSFSGREILTSPMKMAVLWTSNHAWSLADLAAAAAPFGVVPRFDLTFLTPRQAQVIRLHFFEQLSTRKVARAMNLSQPTVIQHIEYAKRKIKRQLILEKSLSWTNAPNL